MKAFHSVIVPGDFVHVRNSFFCHNGRGRKSLFVCSHSHSYPGKMGSPSIFDAVSERDAIPPSRPNTITCNHLTKTATYILGTGLQFVGLRKKF